MTHDPRRAIPRTDTVLARPALRAAAERFGVEAVRAAVRSAQSRAREGGLRPESVGEYAESLLAGPPSSRPVLNATGIVVHTNLGRAPLSEAAVRALVAAAGYTDVELDLGTGKRAKRGAATLAALRTACPVAEDVLVVNNGAAALVLATTALAAGREVIVSRGEMVEIGDGFRLPDLIESTGARLREVGTTNRTHVADYADAIGPDTGCILKVHPSNFLVSGFTSAVPIGELAGLGQPVVADLGSGLLVHDPALPEEPDVTSALTAGADLVIASGDKLLGGPQAGLVLGRADLVHRLRRHPLARALRVDKLTLAALNATLTGPVPPVTSHRRADADELRRRCERLVDELRTRCERLVDGSAEALDGVPVGTLSLDPPHGSKDNAPRTPFAAVVSHTGHVGGGGAPGVPLPGWAIALPEALAPVLRAGDPAVLARTDKGKCLVDPRCVPPDRDPDLIRAIVQAIEVTA